MIASILRNILVAVEVISAILLIAVILIQRTKSQGLGLAFGTGMGESLFGAQMGNVITRITVVLAIVFLVNTTLLALTHSGRVQRSVTEQAMTPAATPAPAPARTPGDMAPSAEQPFTADDMGEGVPLDVPDAPPPEGATDERDMPAVDAGDMDMPDVETAPVAVPDGAAPETPVVAPEPGADEEEPVPVE